MFLFSIILALVFQKGNSAPFLGGAVIDDDDKDTKSDEKLINDYNTNFNTLTKCRHNSSKLSQEVAKLRESLKTQLTEHTTSLDKCNNRVPKLNSKFKKMYKLYKNTNTDLTDDEIKNLLNLK
jgi:hypothetical protein